MQREQLADFLRRRRDGVRPADAGLPHGPGRRTSGLRREEVALLAGVSIDTVVRLEQGRGSRPSPQVLTALARALRLSDDERDHLFHLAGHEPPRQGTSTETARAGLLRVLEQLGDAPAVVLSERGEALAQNRAAVLLMGDHTAFTGDARTIVHRWFTDPEVRALHPVAEQEQIGRELVADLRVLAGRRPGDRAIRGLIERLSSASDDFRRVWADHEAAVRHVRRKTVLHPLVGEIRLAGEMLHGRDPAQRLLVLLPLDAQSRDRLELLLVLGDQELRPATP